ncbi:DUF5518 domain-containing protein [Halovivax limisalsi]|uniref:DUF5518 domain-containing protein n=1 Tax=Halovivax limisalsi TaxID=1453760 RepID=UPI001FFC5D3D|nr:DUF5518 domain-containing protein [Halovivax limisalsi]
MSDVLAVLGRAVRGLADGDRPVATLLGLATVPITIVLSWSAVTDPGMVAGGTISGAPMVLAAVIAGYYYGDRPTSARLVGVQVGLVGSVATVVVYLANAATTIASASGWMTIVSVLLTPVAIALVTAIAVLLCVLGAMGGDWLHAKVAGGRDGRRTGARG